MKMCEKLIKSQLLLIIVTVFVSILTVSASFLWNRKLVDLIDQICKGIMPEKEKVMMMVIYLLFVAITEAGFTLCAGYTGERMNAILRLQFAVSIQKKSNAQLAKMNAGKQISILLNEVEEISSYIIDNLFPLMNNFIKCVVTFCLLFSLNPLLTGLTNLPVVFIFIYVMITSKILGSLAVESQRARQETNGITNTILELFPIMKLYHAEGIMLNRYTEVTQNWVKISSKEEKRRSLLMSLSAIFSCLPTLIMVLTGGLMIISGKMTIGMLYLFINMSANVTGFFMNMPGFIATFRRFISNCNTLQKMEENLE